MKTKTQHYKTVIIAECLDAPECLVTYRKEGVKQLEKWDSWIQESGSEWQKINNKALYLNSEGLSETTSVLQSKCVQRD